MVAYFAPGMSSKAILALLSHYSTCYIPHMVTTKHGSQHTALTTENWSIEFVTGSVQASVIMKILIMHFDLNFD